MTARRAVSTWAWLGVLVLAAAAIAWQVLQPHGAAESDDHVEHDAPASYLVTLPEAQWSAVELLGQLGVHRFERDASGRWLLHAEQPGEAAEHGHSADATQAERIAVVFSTFSRTSIERRLMVDDPGKLAQYGLDRPALIVLVRAADGRPALTLEVGQVAPDGLSRYVRLPRDGSVLTIANFQIAGLLALTGAAAAPAPVSGASR